MTWRPASSRPLGQVAAGTAIVTGGGTGIGAATARRLVADGWAVVLVGRRPGPLAAVGGELGDRVVGVTADAASEEEMARVISTARSSFGRVNLLVANAGGHGAGSAADITDDAWAQSLRANMSTCLVSARVCLPDLVASRGAVVVVSSIAGLAASPASVGDVAAKHGLIGLARSMA